MTPNRWGSGASSGQRVALRCRRVLGVAVLAFGAGCTGQIGDVPGGGSGAGAGGGMGATTGTGTGVGTGTGGAAGSSAGAATGTGAVTGMGGTGVITGTGGTGATLDCSKPTAAPVRARVLSTTQYTNTVRDLFQATGDPGKALDDKVFLQLDQTRVTHVAEVAAAVAAEAAVNLAKWSPCTPPATGDATACEQQIIDKIGNRAYRRALSAGEKTEMKTLFDAGIKEKDFATGVDWFLTGLLQSPDFLYEVARPDAAEVAGEVRPLAPYEYASRMAYFVWDSPPDDKLLAAAAADELADPAKRQTHIDRMLQDAKFMRGVERFYRRWLRLEAFQELARNAAGFDGTIVQSLSTSLLMSATQLYTSGTPNITGLLSGDTYYMNDVLRSFYGIQGTGTTFTAATMTGQNRRGILTHPALMASLARPEESFPIARGLFVMRTLLCQHIPLPPDGLVIPPLPPAQDGVTTRQRYETHSKNAPCNVCHPIFDPAGFALENFDEVGRFRTTDHGQPVNSSGTMKYAGLTGDVSGSFATGDELLAKLATSTDVRTCFAEQYLKAALWREEYLQSGDLCSADALGRSFAATGDLKQLVSALVSSDVFRMRLAEGVAR